MKKKTTIALPRQVPACTVFHDVFSPTECAELIALAHTVSAAQALVGHGANNVVHNMRRSTIRWLNAAMPEMAVVKARVDRCLLKANAQHWGLNAHGYSDFQFTEYAAANAGHYDFHRDDCPEPSPERWTAFDRVLSCVVQLSSPVSYTGGKLEFETGPVTDFEPQGSVIVFPSWHRHRVTPVESGCRYSLVTWSMGPRGQFAV